MIQLGCNELRQEIFELTSLLSKITPLLKLRDTSSSDKKTVEDLILPIAAVLNIEESPDVVVSIAGSPTDVQNLTVIIFTGEEIYESHSTPPAAVLTRRAHTLFFLLQQVSWPNNSRSRVAEAVVSAFSQDLLHKVEDKSAGDKVIIESLTNYQLGRMDELRLTEVSRAYKSFFVDLSEPHMRHLARHILTPLGMQVSKNADINKDTIEYWIRGLGTGIRVLEESLRKNDAEKATECLNLLIGYTTLFNDRSFIIWFSSSSVLDFARGRPSYVFRGPSYWRSLEQPDTCNFLWSIAAVSLMEGSVKNAFLSFGRYITSLVAWMSSLNTLISSSQRVLPQCRSLNWKILHIPLCPQPPHQLSTKQSTDTSAQRTYRDLLRTFVPLKTEYNWASQDLKKCLDMSIGDVNDDSVRVHCEAELMGLAVASESDSRQDYDTRKIVKNMSGQLGVARKPCYGCFVLQGAIHEISGTSFDLPACTGQVNPWVAPPSLDIALLRKLVTHYRDKAERLILKIRREGRDLRKR
ncbi:hypothetical protein BDN72DRAFT_847988 [Pluteus cervinus]|uniref:Uncharacterized protein n=1 Tax=Pluteus cervinus TaxID=181527 RepID=A0ACD3ABU7_9AGAR|nr:hypothetical protein BDN72DRAFT_847988 [Pluteus cervinus]